jgi:hypothetical protein
MNLIGRKFLFGYREYIHTQEYWRCRQYPGGPSNVSLLLYPMYIGGAANIRGGPLMYLYFYTQCILAVPPIPRRPLIRNTYFIPEGSATNTLEAPHTKYLFHTRGYWRCRQYPRGPSYLFLLSYPRVLEAEAPPMYLYFHTQCVLAVPPILRRPLVFLISVFLERS